MRNANLLIALLVLVCGCEDPAGEAAAPEPTPPAEAWSGTIAFEAGVKLGGGDVGDLDSTLEGNEIAAVAADGRIFLVHRRDGEWHGDVIANVPGEMIQCAIGDADPTRPGNEMVVVGMKEGTEGSGGKGKAYLVYRKSGAWFVESIFEDSALVHGVCIGEVDPDHAGLEVVTVGFSRRATVLGRTAEGWQQIAQVDLGSPGKNAVVAKGAAVVACAGGTVTAVTREDDGWNAEALPLPSAGPARIAAHGERFLVACDDGGLRLVTFDGIQEIHRETKKLRGAVLADLDPLVPGTEAATAGYGRTMTLLLAPTEEGGAWTPVTLWRDTERFHHLAAGELLEEGLGLELVGVGYSGRVVVAARTRR